MHIKRTVSMSVALAILIFILPILGGGCTFINEKVVPVIGSIEISEPTETGTLPSESTYVNVKLPPEFAILSEALQALNENYVDKTKLDPQKLSQGAVKGMVEALDDPYSAYVDPQTQKLETSTFQGKFEGIGAVISTKDKQLTVVAPIAGSPAEKAGVKAGDKILEIDGQKTEKLSLIEATFKIRGAKGTSVKLLILHEGDAEPVAVEIIRDEIDVQSVSFEMRDDIAYVQITQFLNTTGDELKGFLEEAISKGAMGVVLDLRNNPGGLLNASADVASQFLAMGLVAKVVDEGGNESVVQVKKGGVGTHLPLIVLVNNGSASASEIVAGALQDYGRAKLAGSQTFGKGSVQVIRNLSDGSALHITAYKWLTPLGRPIDGVGLTPDIVSDLKDEALLDWAIQYLQEQIKTELLNVPC